MSKKLINLLRHGSLPREDNGAIEFWRIKDYLRNHFVHSQHWSDEKWKSTMAKGGGNKKKFQYCTDSSGTILYLRALQGHSGRNLKDPSLQDNVLIPDDFFKYIYHVGCAINLHSIINAGLIPGGQNLSKRQTVFFLPVDPMNKEHKDPETVDLKAPRLAQYHFLHGTSRKSGRNIRTLCIGSTSDLLKRKDWSSIRHDRTPSSFTIHSQPIVSRRLSRWKLEISFTKKNESPRPHPKISLRDNWMKELGSEVAGQAESSQPTQPNPNPIHRTGRLVETEQTSRSSAQEIDTRFSLDCESTNLSVERLDQDKDTDENVDADRVRTGRPVGGPQSLQLEEVDFDFRVSGLPYAVVKQAENFRVRELVKKIENHPHRQDLQADLQQSNAYNPSSEKSKKMFRDMGNVELFELCEAIPKVQCSECLLYWNQGIVYCTCGHLLRENKSSRHHHRWQLDILSIPNYVIKKVRPHGNRHGKTEAQKEHFIAHNLRKKCIKRGLKEFTIAFRKILKFRDSQLKIDRTEAKCIEMDEVAQKDFTYHLSSEEYEI